MLLAIDVGNTNTVFGIDDGSGGWLHIWRISTVRSGLASDWAPALQTLAQRDGLDLKSISACCICSVVPLATAGLTEYAKDWLGLDPLIVRSSLRLNVQLAMEHSQRGWS